ncbi:MAG: hypothetical protein QOF70_3246 [Acetobacteraceae bacterium]|jgi:RimJ/RimL family protein N-acetyltransferase|nr:hypothetical protein [Acetobacteraceae bacterium]
MASGSIILSEVAARLSAHDNCDWPEPEIAYSLDQPLWGRGFATEAATAARDWLFGHFPLPQAASFIRPDNHASKRVTERLGAVETVQNLG